MKDDTISRAAAMELFKDDIAAVNELNNLPSLPSAQPGWIPCSERCPEHRVYVLVTYKPVYGIPDIGITWYSKSEGKWNTSREVLAWMSLPTPYREGEQDEQN